MVTDKEREDYSTERKEIFKKRKEFGDKLVKDFPELFIYKDDLRKSLMQYGAECQPGWFPMIYELTKKVSDIAKRDKTETQVVQIKEKFGGLRYYINSGTYDILKLVGKYEDKSYKICEVCGKPGKIDESKHWLRTLCAKHTKERIR